MLAWLLAGYTAVFWALQWGASPRVDGLVPPLAAVPEVDSGAVARALGGGAAPASVAAVAQPSLAQRFSLQGVLSRAGSDKEAGPGVALLSVDGQKARPYPQGALVDGQWLVRRVEARAVVLAAKTEGREQGSELRVEMPAQTVVQISQKR